MLEVFTIIRTGKEWNAIVDARVFEEDDENEENVIKFRKLLE